MHIEYEVKLDFKDVLIRPKRSTLTSRSDVDITRDFVFRHAGVKYHGIPIIASNMDTTGTLEMARAGRNEDALLGCDFILKMDARFAPARKLLASLRGVAAGTVVGSLLVAGLAGLCSTPGLRCRGPACGRS